MKGERITWSLNVRSLGQRFSMSYCGLKKRSKWWITTGGYTNGAVLKVSRLQEAPFAISFEGSNESVKVLRLKHKE